MFELEKPRTLFQYPGFNSQATGYV